jgi:exoribonuclease-2
MSDFLLRTGSLVVYHGHPARIIRIDDRYTIELPDLSVTRVRLKDLTPLHPGPLQEWRQLAAPSGDLRTAWEILTGQRTTLRDLAELAFGAFTPGSAWAAWQAAQAGQLFRFGSDGIEALPELEVSRIKAAREAESLARETWEGFLDRARRRAVTSVDRPLLQDLEARALGASEQSRTLRALKQSDTPEDAHALLLQLGVWDDTDNPHPRRVGVALQPPGLGLADPSANAPGLMAGRRDLTALPAFAIDDPWTESPDDAISWDGERAWIHVADAGTLVAPDSPVDLEARSRGLTLHLPEGVVPMLPAPLTQMLALGLVRPSPALSFAIRVGPDGAPEGLEIVASLVGVTRLTYDGAEPLLDSEPLRELARIATTYAERRISQGALPMELPEVSVRVRNGDIALTPVVPRRSRFIVENLMLLAGEAVAHAIRERIPVPFATQELPEGQDASSAGTRQLGDLAAMYALRRSLRRTQYRTSPGPHSGLGLAGYAQSTSPLRRYLDLVVHQQLRAHLAGGPLLTPSEVQERIGAVDSEIGAIRQAESLSNRHWALAYLLRNPDWRGEGVLVDRRGRTSTVLVPALGLEPRLFIPAEIQLGKSIPLSVRSVDLPRLEASFRPELA